MNLENSYEKVQGIVEKCRHNYYLHLWEKEDWHQEGLICLYELLEDHPILVENEEQLRRYFKTKYRNRIHDFIRKQESHKRKLDKRVYEDVDQIGHQIRAQGLSTEDHVGFYDLLDQSKDQLSQADQEGITKCLSDERFRGGETHPQTLKRTSRRIRSKKIKKDKKRS